MIQLVAIDEDCNEFVISSTEDDTMVLDQNDTNVFRLFKDGVTLEIRTGSDAC